jgi:hypothetical protein
VPRERALVPPNPEVRFNVPPSRSALLFTESVSSMVPAATDIGVAFKAVPSRMVPEVVTLAVPRSPVVCENVTWVLATFSVAVIPRFASAPVVKAVTISSIVCPARL